MQPLLENWWAIPLGSMMIIVGVRWCITRKIKKSAYPFAREYHYIEGMPALCCGVIAALGGVLVILINTEFMLVDRCLDLGGSYNYENHTCAYRAKNL